ncbi:MAG: hypothetical protein WC829_19760 [Hyphomicrobium sp.]|jgi:hypothetical protein
MRSLGGFVLLAGIGVGLFVYFPAPVDRSTTLEQATLAVAASAHDSQQPVARRSPSRSSSRIASFSPGMALATPQRHQLIAAGPVTTPARVEAVSNWQANVATAASQTLEPTDPDSRYKLVVDIQQNLKRVGCYWGRINGSWNANTRDAMRDFTTRANAALPVEKPDYLLLTLLKSHNGRSCGAPESTVATAAGTAEVLPWKADNANPTTKRLFTPVQTNVVTSEPLPGRMTIGGPTELRPATQEPLIPGSSATTQPNTATGALEPAASPDGTSRPAAAPRPRSGKKSGSWRRPAAGTPRYNLMLSLGGVY